MEEKKLAEWFHDAEPDNHKGIVVCDTVIIEAFVLHGCSDSEYDEIHKFIADAINEKIARVKNDHSVEPNKTID